MTDLVIDATTVSPLDTVEKHTGPSAVAITAGQLCVPDATTGKIKLADASAAAQVEDSGICITTPRFVGDAVTIVKDGRVALGDALGTLAFGAMVYASDTAGALADAAGTQAMVVGVVEPVWGGAPGTPDRVLRLRPMVIDAIA